MEKSSEKSHKFDSHFYLHCAEISVENFRSLASSKVKTIEKFSANLQPSFHSI